MAYFSGDPNAQLLASIDNVIQATVGVDLEVKLPDWTATKTYVVTSGPVGLTIGLKTGVLRWCPTPDQATTHTIAFSDALATYSLTVAVAANPSFVLPPNCGWISNVGTGNGAGPTTSASDARAFRGTVVGGTTYNSTKPIVYFRGGTYPKGSENRRMVVGERAIRDMDLNNVEYRPWGNERVTLRVGENPIRTVEKTTNVVFDGLEVKGDSNKYIYDEAILGWWTGPKLLNSNGIAIGGVGNTVKNCVVHEIMTQAIAFKVATDVVAENNIVANSARWCTAGTCGIGQVGLIGSGRPITEASCKMVGNFLFGVESRIISRVLLKGYAHLDIDEGEVLLQQPSNVGMDASNNYQGRFDISNNFGAYCGKGFVSNGQPKVDYNRNSLYQVGTTLANRFKGLRANKSSDNSWRNNLFLLMEGYAKQPATAYSLAHDLDAAGNPQNGYIFPQLANNYGNSDDGKEAGMTITQNLFANPNGLDPTPHPSIPVGVGADAAHHLALIEKAKSFSVDLTIDPYWQTQDLVQQTRTILDLLPAGLKIDYSNWKNTLAEGEEFDLTVTETTPGALAAAGISGKSFTLTVVHTFPRP
jgi:hypothetical protein